MPPALASGEWSTFVTFTTVSALAEALFGSVTVSVNFSTAFACELPPACHDRGMKVGVGVSAPVSTTAGPAVCVHA
jgi:hypothetical protein